VGVLDSRFRGHDGGKAMEFFNELLGEDTGSHEQVRRAGSLILTF
jgi:hypothetical protein